MALPFDHLRTTRRRFLTLSAGAAAGIFALPAMASASEITTTTAVDGAVVYASSYGFDPTDSTAALQSALDSGAGTVVFDNVGADWLTRPLFVNRDDFQLIVQPGVTVRAKPGGFPNLGDCLLTIMNHSGVTISGYGATLAMNKPEYTSGEWRMGLFLISSSDIAVEGLTVRDTGGDGVYIGNSTAYPDLTPYCQNISLKDLTLDNNRRNALSVISVDGLTATGCAFLNSIGTPPELGVDFEPNSPLNRLSNIAIRDCAIAGNKNFEVAVQMANLDSTSAPVSVLLERDYFGPHHWYTPTVNVYGGANGDPGGVVELRDTLGYTTSSSGSLGVFNFRSDGTQLLLTRTAWWNVGNAFDHYWPIEFYTDLKQPPPAIGAVRFVDSSMITDQAVPIIKAFLLPAGTIVGNVHGNLTVADPNGVTADFGGSIVDVDLMIRALPAAPATTVAVSTTTPSVQAGETANVTFTRDSSDVSAPLAVLYSVAGTAVEREDYSGLPGMAIVPAGASSVTIPVYTRVFDTQPEHARVLQITVASGVGYQVGASSATTVSMTTVVIRPSWAGGNRPSAS